MKRILILIIAGLILMSCSGPRGDSAGIVNGERISYPDFVKSYHGHTTNFQMRTQRSPSNEEKNRIFRETWQNITKHVILQEHFRRYNIRATEQEVIDTLLTTIPLYLQNTPAFKIDGKFDRELYNQSVRYDSPVNMGPIRKNYLDYYVPIQKLKEELITEEVQKSRRSKKIAEIAVSRADFDLVVFDPSEMNPIVSDNEISAYYHKNLENYALDPIYGLEYLAIPVLPEEADRVYTQAVTDSIYLEINQGKSLDNIVSERQERIPGLKVFSSGFVRVENVEPELMSQLEKLPDNSFSKPVRVGHGYSIYHKLQRSKSMVSYRAIQIPPILAPVTINSQFNQAEAAISLATDLGMAETARELDLQMRSLPELRLNELWYQDPAVVEKVNSQLYTHKKGDFLDPVFSQLSGSWMVFKLTENKVNRVRPLSEVRESIVEELTQSKKHSFAEQKAHEFILQHPDLKIPQDHQDFTVRRYNRGGIFSEYDGYSLDISFIRALDRHISKNKPMPDRIGDYHIILIPRAYYRDTRTKIEPAKLRELYVKQLNSDWFDLWMQERMDNAKVQIFVNP